MYLTDKRNNIARELHDHEDLEVLLESFAKQVEEIVNEAENMEVHMKNMVRFRGLLIAFAEQCTIYTRNRRAHLRL